MLLDNVTHDQTEKYHTCPARGISGTAAKSSFVYSPSGRSRISWTLFRDGDVALARVLTKSRVQQGRTTFSKIDFEFRANSGQLVRNHQKDLSETVFEEMTIPVFYDSLDPSKNTALCASYLRISDSF